MFSAAAGRRKETRDYDGAALDKLFSNDPVRKNGHTLHRQTEADDFFSKLRFLFVCKLWRHIGIPAHRVEEKSKDKYVPKAGG